MSSEDIESARESARFSYFGVDVRPLIAVGMLASLPVLLYNKYSPSARADGITATRVDERLTGLREEHLDEHEDWTHDIETAIEKAESRLERSSAQRDLRQQLAIDALKDWQQRHQLEERELLQEKVQAEAQLDDVARRLARIEQLLESMRNGGAGRGEQ